MSSPKTIYTYDLNGSNKLFSIPFEYLARKYVTLTAIGATRKTLVLNKDYRFISATQIQTTVALGGADGFLTLELRRYTSATERLVTFNDGSILRATDMNLSQLQSIHLAEEARDLTSDTIGTTANGELDARGKKIVNVVNGTNNLDAVNYQQLMLAQGSAGQAAASAAASAAIATTKASEAANSATGAANSATAAASSASQASSSASTATTKASEASSSATTATTKASEATSSANSAANSATAAAASESSASTSKTSALNSRDVAVSKAAEASTSASQAASSATGAANSASSAAASATTATNKATDAANSATSAANSATDAANSATTATTKASEASSSASSALTSKNAAATSASQAAGYAAGLNMPNATGNGGKFLAQKSDETGLEYLPKSTFVQTSAGTFTGGNWNSMSTIGSWLVDSTIGTDTNAPAAPYGVGLLEVQGNSSRLIQTFYPQDTAVKFVYQRSYMNSTWSTWTPIWRGGVGSGSGLDADTVDGIHVGPDSNGGVWPFIPKVGPAGVMEIGKFIDFHNVTNESGTDYTNRIQSVDKGFLLDTSEGSSYWMGKEKRLTVNEFGFSFQNGWSVSNNEVLIVEHRTNFLVSGIARKPTENDWSVENIFVLTNSKISIPSGHSMYFTATCSNGGAESAACYIEISGSSKAVQAVRSGSLTGPSNWIMFNLHIPKA